MPAVVRAQRAQQALVDRARTVRRQATGRKVEGTSITEEVTGPWFRCRLALGGPDPKRRDRQGAVSAPSLLYETATEDGTLAVALGPEDTVEVASNQPGAGGRWQLAADPLVIRARVDLLGLGYSEVRRVEEPT